MATTHLSLESIDPSDYVSPDTINNNFAKVDSLGVDYVVESGYSGEWWYRKWKSGRAECGIDDKRFNSMSRNDEWGINTGLYRTSPLSFGAYPFSFKTRPFVVISQNSADPAGGPLGGFVFYDTNTSVTSSPTFRSVDSQKNVLANPHFGIYVVGRYK